MTEYQVFMRNGDVVYVQAEGTKWLTNGGGVMPFALLFETTEGSPGIFMTELVSHVRVLRQEAK